jgi:hypothetical protein
VVLLLLLTGQLELPMVAVVVLEDLLMKVVCGRKCDRKHHRLGLAACLFPSTAKGKKECKVEKWRMGEEFKKMKKKKYQVTVHSSTNHI